MKPWIGLCLNLALIAGVTGFVEPAPAAHAADDTARFYGQWKTSFVSNGQMVTVISVHDANGYRNYLVTPTGFTFIGSGAFSAANGFWMAAAAPPGNQGAYRFVNNNTVIASNALGQTVTWKRDSTPLPKAPAAPRKTATPAAHPQTGASSSTSKVSALGSGGAASGGAGTARSQGNSGQH